MHVFTSFLFFLPVSVNYYDCMIHNGEIKVKHNMDSSIPLTVITMVAGGLCPFYNLYQIQYVVNESLFVLPFTEAIQILAGFLVVFIKLSLV